MQITLLGMSYSSNFSVTPLWSIGPLRSIAPRLTSYYLNLSLSHSHCFSFCHKCSGPSPSQSSFYFVLVCSNSKSSFFYGSGILPHHMSNPLPFLQSDLHCHLFLLCIPPHFFIQENAWPKDLKNFPKATYQ